MDLEKKSYVRNVQNSKYSTVEAFPFKGTAYIYLLGTNGTLADNLLKISPGSFLGVQISGHKQGEKLKLRRCPRRNV